MSLILTSYNIHRCYGRSGHHDADRIRRVIRTIDAQVIALQEVELPHTAPDFLDYLCEDRSWRAIPGLLLARDTGHYGNALLTSLPVRSVQRIDLSFPNCEPRGALHVILEYQGSSLTIIATHLGLRTSERRYQVRRILNALQCAEASPVTVLMGDLNEWFAWGRPLRWLRSYFHRSAAPASFPATFPLLALDRILVEPCTKLKELKIINNSLTKSASDHLPLVAVLE